MSEEEIYDLFRHNFVLMEGEAAYTLFDMGYGHVAGISRAVWHTNESGYKSYAQVCDGRKYCGLADARLSTPYDYIEIEYSGNAMLKTEVKNQYNETVGAAMAVVNNKVFILPYAVDWYGEGKWLLNPFREEIIKAVLMEAARAGNGDSAGEIIFTADAPYVTPYYYEVDGKKVLMLVNSSNDDIEKLRI